MALALIPANLPLTLYLRGLPGRGYGEALNRFIKDNRMGDLPLGETGRFFYTFLPFMLLMALLLLIWRIIHRKQTLSLFTGADRYRWSLMFKALGFWMLICALTDGVFLILRPEAYLFRWNPSGWFLLLPTGLLFITPQVLLEEAFFRSYLVKGGTALTGRPLPFLILFSLLFGLLHGANPEVKEHGWLLMMPQYMGTGLFLTLLAYFSDGLEIPIGIHLANNYWGLLFVNSGGTAFETSAPLTMISWSPRWGLAALALGIFLFLILYRSFHFAPKGSEGRLFGDN